MRRSSETSPRRESASFRHEPKPCQAAVRTREVSSQGSYAQWPFPSPDEKHTRTSYKNEFEHFCDIVVLTNTLCTKGHPETLSNHNGTIDAISQKCPVKFSCRPFSAGTTQEPHGSSVEEHCATPGFLTTICSQLCRNFHKLALSAYARVTSGEGLGRKSQVFAKSKLRPLGRRVSMVTFWTGKLASSTLKLECYISNNFVTWLFVSASTLATFQ